MIVNSKPMSLHVTKETFFSPQNPCFLPSVPSKWHEIHGFSLYDAKKKGHPILVQKKTYLLVVQWSVSFLSNYEK